MNGNHLSMTLPSIRTNIKVAVEAVAAFAIQLDPAENELGDIRICVSEAVDNCVAYAYPGKIGEINLRCQILKNNVLSIVIRDKGKGIANVTQARQPLFTTGGAAHSGMGFTIMESFMDDFSVRSEMNGGTVVRMKKKISVR